MQITKPKTNNKRKRNVKETNRNKTILKKGQPGNLIQQTTRREWTSWDRLY